MALGNEMFLSSQPASRCTFHLDALGGVTRKHEDLATRAHSSARRTLPKPATASPPVSTTPFLSTKEVLNAKEQ
jgi:hypothetical protein